MGFLKITIKSLIILAMVLLMAVPFLLEFLTFRRDKKKKISYKRFRVLMYTGVYILGITIALYLLKELISWLGSLYVIQWISTRIAFSPRFAYCVKVLAVILLNFAIGWLFWSFSKFVRIGLKKKNLVLPKKKNGKFSRKQKIERRIIRFFHTETWFFVGRIVKYLSITLTAVYALLFVLYQIPAVFGASWIPYGFISMLFASGYLYPTITLLGLWEIYFFLEGIRRLEEECPELLQEDTLETKEREVDLRAIDEEVRRLFGDYYACDLELSDSLAGDLASAAHHRVTEFIAQAVERDQRNPQVRNEIYLNCLDKLVGSEKGLLINGNFFSEFSMYFLRYLSAVIARGDNVVFVCNTDAQIDEVYDYLIQGLSEISSLYCKGFQTGDAINFDDPIWRVIKVSGERSAIEDASVDENNILVTSLGYLCSNRFEAEHSRFISLIDVVVFVDALNTVNRFNRQLAVLNTHLKHITKENSLAAKNKDPDNLDQVRYMSRQVRYLCFDDTRIPGLDKILKNLLSVDFDSADAMARHGSTMVRCYRFEAKADENGKRTNVHVADMEEEISAVMNMALVCLGKGASNVTVFADDMIPYANYAEAIAANMGKIPVKVEGGRLRLNNPFYNPDNYSVLIAVDAGDNLPATLRRYISMVSDRPALVIVLSRPYMLRDYYIDHLESIWNSSQIERIPVEEGAERDVAQRILVKANAGGITKEEILRLAALVPRFGDYVRREDINSILREILKRYEGTRESIELFRKFEFASSQDFDETGKFKSEVRIKLLRQGDLFEAINGRDMVMMITGDAKITLPIPRSRLTQNFIAGQNLVYDGNIYNIKTIDTANGQLRAQLAVGGINDETYRYVQAREYRLQVGSDQVENAVGAKTVPLGYQEDGISVENACMNAYRIPMEVLTDGYFALDSRVLAVEPLPGFSGRYQCISDPEHIELAKQTYRQYGQVSDPAFSHDDLMGSGHYVVKQEGALVMSIRIQGQFGSDVDKIMTLAAVMLNETLRSMFPSVADSLAVCPVLQGELADEDAQKILRAQPRLKLVGEHEQFPKTDFQLVIIEDCATDLGVVSVLMSAGNDVLKTLFAPLFQYLKWYSESKEKSEYLYFGLDHEPTCFDFASLYKLAKLLGDDKHDRKYIDLETVLEYDVCDFCGKRYGSQDDVIRLDDGRKMCKACAGNLAGNNKKVLKSHLERAKIFLESTYGVVLDDDYEFCFESTVKIANTLKQNHGLIRRGADIPLKSYVDDKKKVHVETSIPSVNLSELLVRELTHVWQLKHLPDLAEDLAEGHIALVAVQYLRFLAQNGLAAARTTYYESTNNPSGVGYRKLIRELLNHPQFHHNPFRYLLESSGRETEGKIVKQISTIEAIGDYGLPYKPQKPDRAPDGKLVYFYYSRLTETHQKAYDAILTAARNHEERVPISGCKQSDIYRIAEAVAYDHPELFWVNLGKVAASDVAAVLPYGVSAEEAAVIQRRIDEVVPKYLEGIDDSMSAYDAALRIHAKIISAVDYDGIGLTEQKKKGGPAKNEIDSLRTICGALLEGKAVCEGYARAVQYLLQKCGIECAEAAGYIRKDNGEKDKGSHAWHIVKIDGDYYYMDTTWDDRSNTTQEVKNTDYGFSYFCVTTEEMTRSRFVDLCPAEMPNCTATRANFYYHNGLVLDRYDLEKIKSFAQAAAKAKQKAFTFKCTTESVRRAVIDNLYAVGRDHEEVLKAAAKIDKNIVSCTYTHERKIWTLTVKFNYK